MQNINLFKEYEGVFKQKIVEENSDTKQKKRKGLRLQTFLIYENAIGRKVPKRSG